MSKSLGTGIDPLTLIDGGPRPPVFTEGGDFPAYGADAVRYGLLAMSSTQDVRFNEGTIAEGRQLANKLFNASRLVLLRVPEGVDGAGAAPAPATVEDTLDPLAPAGRGGRGRRGDRARSSSTARRRALYRFIYGELCDWYLEMLKPRLYAEDNAETGRVRAARAGRDARAGAPGDPVRDRGDLVAACPAPSDLLMGHRWPEPDAALRDADVEAEVARAIEATQALRDLARRRRRGAGRARAGAARRAPATSASPSTSARLARFEFSANGDEPVATVGVPGGTRARAARPTRSTWRPRSAAPPSAPSGCARRSSASRASSPTRASWPRRPRRSSRPSATSSTSCSRSWTSFHDARGTSAAPRSTCSRSSCSACASGWSACAGCSTALGSPQERFRAVHVVGTNGKSSTVRFTAALLEAHGVRTGAYLSPHLTSFAERIRIGDADRRRRATSAPRSSAPRRPPRRSTGRSPAASASPSSSC